MNVVHTQTHTMNLKLGGVLKKIPECTFKLQQQSKAMNVVHTQTPHNEL